MRAIVDHAALSVTGRVRKVNEDSFLVSPPLFAVADGMGGARAGEVASQVAMETLAAGLDPGAEPEVALKTALESANTKIIELARRDSALSGMGTTATAVLFTDSGLAVGHVGDSRAYVFRNGILKHLTRDHSLVEELLRRGRLTASEALDHPQRSIITRALGPEPEVRIDTLSLEAKDRDVVILCTDGLTTMVGDDRIAAVVGANESMATIVRTLVDDANANGGKDNITVVALRIEGTGTGLDSPTVVTPLPDGPGLGAQGLPSSAKAEYRARDRLSPAAGRPSWRKRLSIATAVAAGVGVIAAGVWLGIREFYFLGVDGRGFAAVYRGLPYELPAGVRLYGDYVTSNTPASLLDAARRRTVTSHRLRSRTDALDLLSRLDSDEAVR